MSELIRIENVSKRYRLGTINRGMLYKDMQSWWARKRGKEDPHEIVGEQGKYLKHGEEFWALRDINLTVNAGDSIGVIGRNGAGKSTMLKILSRTTSPTKGTIKTRGRVASLLEVGTGFHPELTGRENVFLNGAILGMRQREVRSKFEEIVEFAEIGEFIDTPVKRYSSGMYVRLAFAVAAHLDPEVLIVDEVLAVGDANFQKKCIGKMNSVNKDGRTVIFVSHNLAMLTSLCNKGIVLKNGKVDFEVGELGDAINHYINEVKELSDMKISDRKDRNGQGKIKINDLKVVNLAGETQTRYISGQSVEFNILYKVNDGLILNEISFAIGVYQGSSNFITLLASETAYKHYNEIKGEGIVKCRINSLPFTEGQYILNVIVRHKNDIQDWIQEAKLIQVENGDYFGTGKIVPESHGGVLLQQEWSHPVSCTI